MCAVYELPIPSPSIRATFVLPADTPFPPPISSLPTPSPRNVAFPSVFQLPAGSTRIAAPHQIAPPPCLIGGVRPDPEVYANMYDLLRQRWETREEEIMSHETARRSEKRRLEDSSPSSALRRVATRRSSILSREETVSIKEEEEEEDVKPLKRSKTNHENLISFFDNPPPAPSSSSSPIMTEDGFLQPPLPPRRTQSLSPRIPSSSTSRDSPRSTPLNPRKRSVSQPCDLRRLSISTNRQRRADPLLTDSPFTSLPHSQSAPQLSQLASPLSSRSEALLHVVKSFEAVLACRAEGWRRLATRKSSATSSTLTFPSTFPASSSL
ncbi:uncharacterized protein JCM6883_007190 [Sporobolomyces salmoneus]|uniref:uncharacterized protein n=1 Tax=Sporobolomyces salmoneus TaxID=183962 RepID=UPI003172502D